MNGIELKELAFVGYPVTDFAQARRFYGDILGLKEAITFGGDEEIDWLEYDPAGHEPTPAHQLSPPAEETHLAYSPSPHAPWTMTLACALTSQISTRRSRGCERGWRE